MDLEVVNMSVVVTNLVDDIIRSIPFDCSFDGDWFRE
jgi:hypothetical protein